MTNTPPLVANLTAAGQANRLVLPLVAPDTQALVIVSGAYAGLNLVIQQAADNGPGGANWFGAPAIRAIARARFRRRRK